jgi:type I restriction enzyme, S subunit
VIRDTDEKIAPAGLDNSAAKILPKGSLLVAMYGQGVTRGKVAILGLDASTNQACIGVLPKSDDLVSRFLYYYLAHSYERLRRLSHGANQQNLSGQLIGGFEFPLPHKQEQLEIVSMLETVDRTIAVHERKLRLLRDLFWTLLRDTMTGEIRVNGLHLPFGSVTAA